MSARLQIVMNGRVAMAQLRRGRLRQMIFALRGLGRGLLQLL